VLVVAGVVGVAGWFVYYTHAEFTPRHTPLQFELRTGSSLRSAAQQMADAGALDKPMPFVVLARLSGVAGKVKAGQYEVDGPITPLALLRKITQGDYTQVAVTFVEGWTFRQMRRTMDEHPALKHDSEGLTDAELLRRLGINQSSPEGWFFPDTYHFNSGASDLSILRRAHRLMQARLVGEWKNRAAGLPLASPYEALILASIIEKETGMTIDRPLIAAVLVNRLKAQMKLQADPTVIYGMGEHFDGNLRKNDLTADTPYNTYTREGLPPTPIAMPGLASLAAALNPAPSDVLYFVSKGDGNSHFSRTLDEHNRAVTKYQKFGRH